MAQTIKLPPYGKLKLAPRDTLALLNANIPWLIVRNGSDAVRLPVGHCYNFGASFVEINNPFPVAAWVTISRGLPPLYGPEPEWQSQPTKSNIISGFHVFRPAQVTGLKFAVGVMLKKGRAVINVFDGNNDGKSSMMIFPAAQQSFVGFKPVGAMADTTVFRFGNGDADTAIHSVSGTYTDADVTAWIAAASYVGSPVVMKAGSQLNNNIVFEAADDAAVFWVRDADQIASAFIRVTHQGVGTEGFQ